MTLYRAGRRIAVTFLVLGTIVPPGLVDAAPDTWVADYVDEFNGPTLDPGWSFRDGYALAFPADVANHASFGLADGHLNISIPGGQEHNMWDLKHAQATRAYEGSGVYQIKLDSALAESQQFGLAFESSPGTFMLFMLYAHDRVEAYVERFVMTGNGLVKHTTQGQPTGLSLPNAAPHYVRVIVDDAADPTQRTWTFEWSIDGANWQVATSGVMEGSEPADHIGTIQTVSLFAGNQPNAFAAFNAQFDYFYATSNGPAVPLDPPIVTASASPTKVDLVWNQVLPEDDYRVYRSNAAGGPYALIGTVPEPGYSDLSVVAGTTYYYAVSVVRGAVESQLSTSVGAFPHNTGLESIPNNGLVVALLASELQYQVADGAPVTQWAAANGTLGATGSGSSRPTFVSSGMGGAPAVRFDGVNDHLTLPAGYEDFTAGMSMFIVTRPGTLQPGFKMIALGNGAGQQNIGLGRAGSTSGLQYFTTRSDGSFGWFDTAGGLVAGETSVYSVVQAGGAPNSTVAATATRDGAVIGSGNVFVPPNTTRAVNYIGRSYWNEGWFQGDIAEILVYNRQLSPAEQTTVAGYLTNKFSAGSPTTLAPPTGVTATAGNATVGLTWNAVSGATGYRIYRAAGNATATLLATPTTTNYTDNAVTNGTTYTYTIRTLNAVGEGTPSTPTTATPTTTASPIPTTGLVLGLDASTLATTLANGAAVTTWTGTGANATGSGTARPTLVTNGIGGKPSVRFDGIDDSLNLSSGFSDFTAGVSMFIVARSSALQYGFKFVSLGNGAGQQNIGVGRAGSTSGLQYFTTRSDGAYGWYDTAAGLVVDQSQLIAVTQGGGAANSTVTGTATINGNTIGGGTVYVPPVATRGLNYIGNSYWNEGRFAGDIAEILIYNRTLTPAETTTITNYLTTKYSLPG